MVDLVRRQLVVHTDPAGDHYSSVVTLDETATEEALGVPIPLATVFALA